MEILISFCFCNLCIIRRLFYYIFKLVMPLKSIELTDILAIVMSTIVIDLDIILDLHAGSNRFFALYRSFILNDFVRFLYQRCVHLISKLSRRKRRRSTSYIRQVIVFVMLASTRDAHATLALVVHYLFYITDSQASYVNCYIRVTYVAKIAKCST